MKKDSGGNKKETTKFEKIEGVVNTIYEDFDTGEPVIKERAIAFLLDTDKDSDKGIDKGPDKCSDKGPDKKGKVIVVYDKNALKLGLIKVGEPLTCLGSYDGTIAAIDPNGNVVEDKRFLCRGIVGNADINEEELTKQGAIRLR